MSITVQHIIDNDILTGCNQLIQHLSEGLNYNSCSLVECEPQLFFKEDRSELPVGFTIEQEMLTDKYVVLDEDGEEMAYDADEETAISESWDNAIEEPPTVEALQFWIVSDWLAHKLEDAGALVARDVLGFALWGRTECGQSLAYDSDLNAVAEMLGRV